VKTKIEDSEGSSIFQLSDESGIYTEIFKNEISIRINGHAGNREFNNI